MDLIC